MGGCLSVSVSCDQLVNYAFSCLFGDGNHIRKLEDNLDILQTSAQQLRERRDDLLRRVETEEEKGLRRFSEVQGWLSRVRGIELQVDDLLKDSVVERQRLCLYSWCSKNCISSCKYGKRVFKIRKEVEDLMSNGAFEAVAGAIPGVKVEKRPTEPTVGTGTMLEKAWNRLMEDGVGILGLHGMGGVGKTTLLTHINNKFHEAINEFDIVIWVLVSRDLQIERIQEDISKKLGFSAVGWLQKRQDEKAVDIYNVLSKKKFVLLLDDVWTKVTLSKIGVPVPNRENGCKVAFTCRSKEVCGSMGVDAEMEVECLAPDIAWDLFQKKVGGSTLNSHPNIRELAKTVAQKCRGLPLALNVIGETMACKRTVREWRYAIDILTSSAAEFSGMEDKILPILKFSYDSLKGDKVKLCFLYCALFPEDFEIRKDDLVDYWVGEGIIDENRDRESVENEGHEIIGTLVHTCLLMEGDKLDDGFEKTVKLHDVIREMALWIASDFGKQKQNFFVKAGARLGQMPKVVDWNTASRMSLMRNQIESTSNSPECPKLSTLFLQNNKLVNISSEFFRYMPTLVVLDLSGNFYLTQLPEEISQLFTLRYLNLSYTRIKQLPTGLKELKRLIYLNLESTRELQGIDGISNLSKMQALRLSGSNFPPSLSLVEELQRLEHLELLTISLKDASVLERFLSIHKLASCTRRLFLEEFTSTSAGISLVTTSSNLRYLAVERSNISEIKIDRRDRGIPLRNPCFQNLFHMVIRGCKGLRDLTWLLSAPNLTFLHVAGASQMEEIISKEKAVGLTEQPNVMPFQKLESLELFNLRELKSIYAAPLPFPCLRNVRVSNCLKLRKLPLNSESAKGHELVVLAEEEWMKDLEWEDEASKKRFCPN